MPKLSPERKKLIEMVAKLLNLANDAGATTAESEVARRKALELMAKHNIREASQSSESFTRESQANYQPKTVAFSDLRLKSAIGRLNNIYVIQSGQKLELYGKPSDIEAYHYTCAIVARQQAEAFVEYMMDGGTDKMDSWKLGFADGVKEKVEIILTELGQITRGWGLVPVSLVDQAKAYAVSTGLRLGVAHSNVVSSAAGREAGLNVTFTTGVGTTNSGPVLRIK